MSKVNNNNNNKKKVDIPETIILDMFLWRFEMNFVFHSISNVQLGIFIHFRKSLIRLNKYTIQIKSLLSTASWLRSIFFFSFLIIFFWSIIETSLLKLSYSIKLIKKLINNILAISGVNCIELQTELHETWWLLKDFEVQLSPYNNNKNCFLQYEMKRMETWLS